DPLEDRLVERPLLLEVHAILAGRAIEDRLGDGVRLFVYLLERERLEAALLGGLLVPVDGRLLALDLLAAGSRDRHPAGPQHDDLSVLHVLHTPRLSQEGGYRRGDEL